MTFQNSVSQVVLETSPPTSLGNNMTPENQLPDTNAANDVDVPGGPQSFHFTLPEINSVSGISSKTLAAIANSYNVDEQNLIQRALVLMASEEIPGLNLDAPHLSELQLQRLKDRRDLLDAANKDINVTAQVVDQLIALLRVDGEDNANLQELKSRNGDAA